MTASVSVGAGQSTVIFNVTTVGVVTLTNAVITATANGTIRQTTLVIKPATVTSVTLNPTVVVGNGDGTGTVLLSGPAGPGGLTISLSSSNPAATVPATLSLGSGQSSATFSVAVNKVTMTTSAVVTATLGSGSQSATLTMEPLGLASLSLSPASVAGGVQATGTITLNGPAPKAGFTVKLLSSLSAVSVPASVTIHADGTNASFKATTTAVVAQKVVTVTAKLDTGVETATLTVMPPALRGLTMSPASVAGGSSATGTVTLTGPAPAGGIKVSLWSGDSAAGVESSVTVPAEKDSENFTVKTGPVATAKAATIQASLNGVSLEATLTLEPPVLTKLKLRPATVAGGKDSTGTVTIGSEAPAGGITIELSSSQGAAIVPGTVTIAAGKTSATFSVKTTALQSKTAATVTAAFGSSTKSATLTIT